MDFSTNNQINKTSPDLNTQTTKSNEEPDQILLKSLATNLISKLTGSTQPIFTDPPVIVPPEPPRKNEILNHLNIMDKYIKDPRLLFTKMVNSGEDLFKALSTITGLKITNERRSAIYDFFKHLLTKKSADVDNDKDTDIFDTIKVFQNGGFNAGGVVQPIDFGLGKRNKEANEIRNKIFETIVPHLKKGVIIEQLQPTIDMFLKATIQQHLYVQGIAPPSIEQLLNGITNLTNEEGQKEMLQEVNDLVKGFLKAFPPKKFNGDDPPPPMFISNIPVYGDPREVLPKDPPISIPPFIPPTVKLLNFIDNVIKNPSIILEEVTTWFFWNPQAYLFKALQGITGTEVTKENKEAVLKFLNHIKENKSADIDDDKDTDIFDIFKVYQSGVFEINNPPPPSPKPEKIIQDIIDQAKETAKGNLPIHPIPIKDVFAALEKFTGIKSTKKRQAAIQQFLYALSHNKPADVDGTGITGLKDIVQVWKKGRFVPIGWNPIDGTSNNENNKIDLQPINFGVGPYGITDEENQKANDLRLGIYEIITPLLTNGLTENLLKEFDGFMREFIWGHPGPYKSGDPTFFSVLENNMDNERPIPANLTDSLRNLINQFPKAKIQMK